MQLNLLIRLGSAQEELTLYCSFKIANIMPIDEFIEYMKSAIKKSYMNKGEDVVNMNCNAVDAGVTHVHKVKVPGEIWKNIVVSDNK